MRASPRLLLAVATLAAALPAATGIALFETSPSSFAMSGSYDLLQGFHPTSRTYSGLIAYRNKTEAAFSTAFLPEHNLQTLEFTYGKPVLAPWLRFGMRGTYMGLAAFNDIDEKGAFVRSIEGSTVFAGITGAFDPSTITWTAKTRTLEAIAKQINIGVNLNVLSMSFDGSTPLSVMGDVNLVGRLKVGNLGMPRPLLTVDDLDRERDFHKKEGLARLDREARLRQQQQKKGDSDEGASSLSLERKRQLILQYWDDLYEERKVDLGDVLSTRSGIYKIYNDETVNLTSLDLSNLTRTAVVEIGQLHIDVVNELTNSEALLQRSLDQGIRKITAEIDDIMGKVESNGTGTEAFRWKMRVLKSSFDAYVRREYQPETADEIRQRFLAEAGTVKAGGRETWRSIAKDRYQQEAHAAALQAFNQGSGPLDQPVRAGTSVRVPDRAYFDELGAREATRKQKEREQTGSFEYTVGSNESWESISEKTMLSKTRATALATFNKRTLRDKLVAGQSIRIPQVQAEEERKSREKAFHDDFASKRKDLQNLKLDTVSSIYVESLFNKMDDALAQWDYKRRLVVEREEARRTLGNTLTREKAALERARDVALASLERSGLKKRLDLISAGGNEKARDEIYRETKRRERILFVAYLDAVNDSKIALFEQFKKVAKNSRDQKIRNAQDVAKFEMSVIDQSRRIGNAEAGQDKAKLALVEKAYQAARENLSEDQKRKIARIEDEFRDRVALLDWRAYTTEMIYRGSAETRDTLAFGFRAKNLGIPLKWGSQYESVPAQLGFDATYEVIGTQNQAVLAHAHWAWADFGGHQVGFAATWKGWKRLEVRSGIALENLDSGTLQPVPSLGVGAQVELGLMLYRIDLAAQYRPGFGFTYNGGLAVTF